MLGSPYLVPGTFSGVPLLLYKYLIWCGSYGLPGTSGTRFVPVSRVSRFIVMFDAPFAVQGCQKIAHQNYRSPPSTQRSGAFSFSGISKSFSHFLPTLRVDFFMFPNLMQSVHRITNISCQSPPSSLHSSQPTTRPVAVATLYRQYST